MEETTATLIGYIFIFILIIAWIGSIFYCYSVAKKLNKSKILAILVGLLLPILGPIFYSHRYHYPKKKDKEES